MKNKSLTREPIRTKSEQKINNLKQALSDSCHIQNPKESDIKKRQEMFKSLVLLLGGGPTAKQKAIRWCRANLPDGSLPDFGNEISRTVVRKDDQR